MSETVSTAAPNETRNCLVSRQPVFEPNRQVFGYELLFPLPKTASAEEGDEAASRVLRDTLSVFGLHQLAEGHRAFIPFTSEALLQGYAALFPREQAVIVPQHAGPSPGVFDACAKLRKDGYWLAVNHPLTVCEVQRFGQFEDELQGCLQR